MLRFILASQSPRRSFLLQKHGFVFHTFPVEISEFLNENLSIELAVEDLAKRKAQALVESGRIDTAKPHLILSADTIVHFRGEVLGKPKDRDEAFKTLKKLSGQGHQVITAFCLWNTKEDRAVTGHCVSQVQFREIPEQEIWDYIATGDPMDKAGAYGIQSLGRTFVTEFTGTLENIAGLPVDEVEKMMVKEGWVVR